MISAVAVAVVPMLAESIATVGLRSGLESEDTSAVNILASLPIRAATPELDSKLRSAASSSLPVESVTRRSQSVNFSLRAEPSPYRAVVFVAHEEAESRVTVISGSWPSEETATGPLEVAVSEPAAALLDVSVGEIIETTTASQPRIDVDARVTAIYRIDDPDDPYWWALPLDLGGQRIRAEFTTTGPLLVSPAAFESRLGSIGGRLEWRIILDGQQIRPDTLADVTAGIGNFTSSLSGDQVRVETEFGAISDGLRQELAIANVGIIASGLQLATMAVFACWAASAVLAGSLRRELVLLERRGATKTQTSRAAFGQASLLGVPAIAVGPPLAAWLIGATSRLGVFAGTEITLEPVLGGTAFAASAAIVLAGVLIMTITASRSQRSGARLGFAQRSRLDLVLVAIAAFGVWQLGRDTSLLTGSSGLGVDPLLVAVPGLTLLAAPALVLRVVPQAGRLIEFALRRRADAATWLGLRSFTARHRGQAVSSILLVVALGLLVFAVAFGATWRRSQLDRASHVVGADIVATPQRGAAAHPAPFGEGYADVGGVIASAPVVKRNLTSSAPSGGGSLLAVGPSFDLVALDRNTLLGDRLRVQSLPSVHGEFGVALPGNLTSLIIDVAEAPAPGMLEVALRDGNGVLHTMNGRFEGPSSVPLEPTHGGQVDGGSNLTLIGAKVTSDSGSPAGVTLGSLLAANDLGDRVVLVPWEEVPVDDESRGVRFVAGAPAHDVDIPVLVSRSFAEAALVSTGDLFNHVFAERRREFRVVGVIDRLATIHPSDPLVVMDLANMTTLTYLASGFVGGPDEWWLSSPGDNAAQAVPGVRVTAPETMAVRTEVAEELLLDPIPLGLISVSLLGSILAGGFVAVTLGSALVTSIDKRRPELASLRLVGMTPRQLSKGLATEHAVMLLVSGAAGVGLGVVISQLLLGSVTLGSDGTAPVPPVLVVLPRLPVAMVASTALLALVALAAAVAARIGRLRPATLLRAGDEPW